MPNTHPQTFVCLTCRLHQAILTKQCLRSKKSVSPSFAITRSFRTTPPASIRQRNAINNSVRSQKRQDSTQNDSITQEHGDDGEVPPDESFMSVEEIVRRAREIYGERLPDHLLSEEQGKVYERLYGRPFAMLDEREQPSLAAPDGQVEIEGADEEEIIEEEEDDAELAEDDNDFRTNRDMEQDSLEEEDEVDEDELESGAVPRAHRLTIENRFGTNPSTFQLPRDTFLKPINDLTAHISNAHIKQAALNVFGGSGLPDSASAPAFAKTRQQLSIPLTTAQSKMTAIEADAFLHTLMPPFFASIMSVLVETRKRLGTAWAENLVRKANTGDLRILDAGGAGVGILAVRQLLKAEWERMIEEQTAASDFSQAIARPTGKTGGAGMSPPLGIATVHVASDALRRRASHLLENTTFIPRLPDYLHTEDAKQTGKYDLVLSMHTIWPIREGWERRQHIHNLWSLLKADGGVLCMLEKGVARGFEAVADARKLLIETRIDSSAFKEQLLTDASEAGDENDEIARASLHKEAGMIIAPCTHHFQCPMYLKDATGTIKGRKDYCHFKQRYIRPPPLQRILGSKDKNFEDLKYSYLSVMRGQDMRSPDSNDFDTEPMVVQGEEAALLATKGYENSADPPSSMSLPRMILPPLKRKGHVILDVCSPSGSLERWTVPRSFSKQAFRDARKSAWGDLWPLGAKTRLHKTAKLGKHARRQETGKKEPSRKKLKQDRKRKERSAKPSAVKTVMVDAE